MVTSPDRPHHAPECTGSSIVYSSIGYGLEKWTREILSSLVLMLDTMPQEVCGDEETAQRKIHHYGGCVEIAHKIALQQKLQLDASP